MKTYCINKLETRAYDIIDSLEDWEYEKLSDFWQRADLNKLICKYFDLVCFPDGVKHLSDDCLWDFAVNYFFDTVLDN